jgi:hypothetical protein
VRLDASLWRERAWYIAPAILFFLGNFAYFLGGRAVDSSRTQALERARRDARDRLERAESAQKKAVSDAARVDSVRRVEEEFFGKRIGSLNDTVAATVSDIHRVCRTANVAPHSISYGVTDRRNIPLSEMGISFGVSGDYRTLRKLLQSFENDPRWIVVRQVGLARASETVAAGNIHLNLATYFYEGPVPRSRVAESVPKARGAQAPRTSVSDARRMQ